MKSIIGGMLQIVLFVTLLSPFALNVTGTIILPVNMYNNGYDVDSITETFSSNYLDSMVEFLDIVIMLAEDVSEQATVASVSVPNEAYSPPTAKVAKELRVDSPSYTDYQDSYLKVSYSNWTDESGQYGPKINTRKLKKHIRDLGIPANHRIEFEFGTYTGDGGGAHHPITDEQGKKSVIKFPANAIKYGHESLSGSVYHELRHAKEFALGIPETHPVIQNDTLIARIALDTLHIGDYDATNVYQRYVDSFNHNLPHYQEFSPDYYSMTQHPFDDNFVYIANYWLRLGSLFTS